MPVTRQSGKDWDPPSGDTTVLFLPPQEDTREPRPGIFGVAVRNGMVTDLVVARHFDDTIGDHLPHAQVGKDTLYLFPVGGINDDAVKAVPVSSVVEAMRQGPQRLSLEDMDDIKQLRSKSDSDLLAETIATLLPADLLSMLNSVRRRGPASPP